MAPNNENLELLSAYLDEEVTADQRAEIERWLAEDAEARVALDEMRRLKMAVGGLPRATAPRDLAERVAAQIERDALLEQPSAGPPIRVVRWLVGLGAAATIALAVTIGITSQSREESVTNSEPAMTVADAESAISKSENRAVDLALKQEQTPQSPRELGEQSAQSPAAAAPPTEMAEMVESDNVAPASKMARELKVPSGGGIFGGSERDEGATNSLMESGDEESTDSAGQRAKEQLPAIRAMARAEDRDEVLFRVYQFVAASPSADFVKADVSEMTLLIPGLDWLFLGLPVGDAPESMDQFEVLLDESEIPELLIALDPLAGVRYELGAAGVDVQGVTLGRLAGTRRRNIDAPAAAESAGVGGSLEPRVATSRPQSIGPIRAPATQPVQRDAAPTTTPRRVRVVFAFQSEAPGQPAEMGSSATTQPIGGTP